MNVDCIEANLLICFAAIVNVQKKGNSFQKKGKSVDYVKRIFFTKLSYLRKKRFIDWESQCPVSCTIIRIDGK